MPHQIKLFPYKIGSNSARELATNLGVKRVRPNGTYRPRVNHLVINWGNSSRPSWYHNDINWINHPDSVKMASNKLAAFRAMKANSVSIPKYTTDINEALTWINNGSTVVERHLLNSHSGNGIILCSDRNDLQQAPMYVEYIKKKHEYRVHVFNGEVIDVQQKKRRVNFDGEINHQVRNHHTGWIYARGNIRYDVAIEQLAINAVNSINGLIFGAVDIIWNEFQNRYYVLEINTAPGLEGTTVQKYQEAITKFNGE